MTSSSSSSSSYLPYSCHLLASAAIARGPTVARWVMAAWDRTEAQWGRSSWRRSPGGRWEGECRSPWWPPLEFSSPRRTYTAQPDLTVINSYGPAHTLLHSGQLRGSILGPRQWKIDISFVVFHPNIATVYCNVLTSDPWEVGIVRVGGQTKQLDVVVAELWDGAPAPPRPPAVERVGGAGRHLPHQVD